MVCGALLGRGLIKNIGETQKKPRERNQLEVITWEIHQILGDLMMLKFFSSFFTIPIISYSQSIFSWCAKKILAFFHNTNNFKQPINFFLTCANTWNICLKQPARSEEVEHDVVKLENSITPAAGFQSMTMMMMMMMTMMMMTVCARNTYGTNTYRYSFRR